MARTKAMGLRREPQPPMPIVMPLRNCATASSSVVRLSGIMRRSSSSLRPPQAGGTPSASSRLWLLHKRVAVLVGNPGEVELERKALLHTVTRVDPLHVD